MDKDGNVVDVTTTVNLAAEYYGSVGTLNGGFYPYQQQQHQLFGVVNINFGPDWEFNAGLGNGWTRATDHLIVFGVDMPFMTEKYLRKLCARIEPGRGVVPIIEDRAEPLTALQRPAHRW